VAVTRGAPETHEVVVQKLVHGGQGLGELADGRKVFVWGALPGERLRVRIITQKRSYAEAVAEEVLEASPDRVVPVETNYLATSPWQILNFAAENRYKAAIVRELFTQAGVDTAALLRPVSFRARPGIVKGLSDASKQSTTVSEAVIFAEPSLHYRNKMEYSFWGDDDGLHLALHQRGSHGKYIVQGSALALPAVDAAAHVILDELRKLEVRAGDLKTLVVRCDQKDAAVASLFVKPNEFPRLKLPSQTKNPLWEDSPPKVSDVSFRGLRVYHSNPKSPASVATKLLYEVGDCHLRDELLGKTFCYDVDSFFQVNVPVYERALADIGAHCQGDPVDMYAGVGTIGLSVARKAVTLVELDAATAAMGRKNAAASGLKATVVETSTEKALEYIDGSRPVVFDPPRAGLHAKVVARCLAVRPPQILYLSCNPATQARDVALLQDAYTVTNMTIYNFFPRTPHIEALTVLTLNS
jgi:23S rRNA (uracil1939-C5)-methyltransferase